MPLVTTIAEAGAIVEVQTSLGTFYLEIDEESAPLTGGNFLNYVEAGDTTTPSFTAPSAALSSVVAATPSPTAPKVHRESSWMTRSLLRTRGYRISMAPSRRSDRRVTSTAPPVSGL